MAPRTREFRYDAKEQIVFTRCLAPVRLETTADIDEFFEASMKFWSEKVKTRVYYVVDITNLSINMREVDAYARNIGRVLETCAFTIVRHGGDPLQRTAGRIASMRLHVPSHIYSTRDEAVEVVRRLRDGRMKLGAET